MERDMIMSKKFAAGAVMALFGILAPALSSGARQSAASLSGPALEAFLDQAAERFKSLADPRNWSALVVSTQTEMDRKWTPETVTIVRKNVTFTDGERDEAILEALETKDGQTRDITVKYAAAARKNLDRERKRRAEELAKAGTEPRRADRMALDEILPFSAKKRPEYVFRPVEGVALDGAPTVVFDVEAKIKDDKHWQGRFWFDRATADLRRVEIKPADNPPFVKEIDIAITFDTHPSGPIVLRSFRMRINAGMFLKHVRRIVVEEYSDYRIGPGPGGRNP
jgi:hypothetical protein